jgi:hypothetical protein
MSAATATPAAADPIFEAIAEHRRLFESVGEAGAFSGSLANDAGDAMERSEDSLASLQPTTLAGVAAIVDYRNELEAKGYRLFPEREDAVGERYDLTTWLDTIKRAVQAFVGSHLRSATDPEAIRSCLFTPAWCVASAHAGDKNPTKSRHVQCSAVASRFSLGQRPRDAATRRTSREACVAGRHSARVGSVWSTLRHNDDEP